MSRSLEFSSCSIPVSLPVRVVLVESLPSNLSQLVELGLVIEAISVLSGYRRWIESPLSRHPRRDVL